jgi:hypothetical protein
VNSFFDNPAAFAPFFTERCLVCGKGPTRRHIAATLQCCVLDEGFAEPISEEDSMSEIAAKSVSFRVADWPFTDSPQVGDIVELDDGGRFSVAAVNRDNGEWRLSVRQSKSAEVC